MIVSIILSFYIIKLLLGTLYIVSDSELIILLIYLL